MNEDDVLRFWDYNRKVTEEQVFIENAFLTNVDVVNGWCLPLRDGKPAIPPGHGFGWHKDHINAIMRNADTDISSNITSEIEDAVLLSFPGAYTYGHWIVDIAARLVVAEGLIQGADIKYLIPGPRAVWFSPFLSAFGIPVNQCIPVSASDRVRVKRLIVPNFFRVNDYLPGWPYSESFNRLRKFSQGLSRDEEGLSPPKKLWVKRTITSANRPDLLEESIAELLSRYEFEIVTPSDFSVTEQASIFSGAAVVVGEDSSSLHNIVWGSPKHLLAICSSDRPNVLHYSICKLRGIDCHYLFGDAENGKYSVDLQKLEEKLETITK